MEVKTRCRALVVGMTVNACLLSILCLDHSFVSVMKDRGKRGHSRKPLERQEREGGIPEMPRRYEEVDPSSIRTFHCPAGHQQSSCTATGLSNIGYGHSGNLDIIVMIIVVYTVVLVDGWSSHPGSWGRGGQRIRSFVSREPETPMVS